MTAWGNTNGWNVAVPDPTHVPSTKPATLGTGGGGLGLRLGDAGGDGLGLGAGADGVVNEGAAAGVVGRTGAAFFAGWRFASRRIVTVTTAIAAAAPTTIRNTVPDPRGALGPGSSTPDGADGPA